MFASFAANLVPGDTNEHGDFFVHDRSLRTTVRVNVSSRGDQANDESYGEGAISADDRYVAFDSRASTLVRHDTNGWDDVFVHSLASGRTERVSLSSEGAQGNQPSAVPSLSRNGRFVAFESGASNLVPGDTNGDLDIFIRDRKLIRTKRVSLSYQGGQANGQSLLPAISANGRFVAFYSEASNLVPGDTNGLGDIFVRDLVAGTNERVDVSSEEEQADGTARGPGIGISANGRYVVFPSDAANLVAGDTNGLTDVFVRDRPAGTTIRASVASTGEEADGSNGSSSISPDGGYVEFYSLATNLVPGDTNGWVDAFVYELATGRTIRVSVSITGEQAQASSGPCTVSAHGRFAGFSSDDDDLVPEDTNGWGDVFVRGPLAWPPAPPVPPARSGEASRLAGAPS